MRLASGLFLAAVASVATLTASLPLNAETKATASNQAKHAIDAATRDAMVNIRKIVAGNRPLIMHRRMPKTAAQLMTKRVLVAVKSIREASTLNGDARMEMALILEDIEKGAKAISGPGTQMQPIDGVVLIDDALGRYAHSFDHPN